MTTIAWDGEILAVDSRMCGSMIRSEKAKKLHKIGNIYVAGCGNMEDVIAMVEWVKNGKPKEKPLLHDSFAALVWERGKVYRYEQKLFPFPIAAPFAAAGSGYEVALGAMSMGADAIKAVRIASKFDPQTNNIVRYVRPKK